MSSTAPRTVNAYAGFEKSGPVKPWQYQTRELGAEDVEIAISHCGICATDVHSLDSGWGPTEYPCVVGHEIVGRVTLVGADVKHLVVGDRVGVGAQAGACLNKDPSQPCKECADGSDAHCSRIIYTYNGKYPDGATSYGGYADAVRLSSHYAFKIPDAIPSEAAGPLLCAGVTVFKPLKDYAKAGDRVGVVGIGGLGHLAIQFIRAVDAVPVAFSRTTEKEKECRDLGAEEFYSTSDPEHIAKATGTLDVLLITADALNQPYDLYMGLLRPSGTCVMLSVVTDQIKFYSFGLIMGSRKFAGSTVGSIKDIKEMLEVAAKKNVQPVIQRLPMSRANEGIQMVRDGKARYRVVLEN